MLFRYSHISGLLSLIIGLAAEAAAAGHLEDPGAQDLGRRTARL
jgi:hypothetical protein